MDNNYEELKNSTDIFSNFLKWFISSEIFPHLKKT